MRLVKATSSDGRTYIPANGGWHVAQKSASNPFYRPSLTSLGGNVAGEKLERPYEQSPWVMRAIKMIADPIASVSLRFAEDARAGKKAVEDPALLAFWEKPARDRSGAVSRSDFLEATVGWLKLAGETFWVMGDDWLIRRLDAGQRTPLIVARPDRMRELVSHGHLLGWEYTDASHQRHALLAEQVVHLKFWNPYDELRGLAEYEAARTAAEGDYLAGKFSLNLMRNNGDRGEYIIAKSGMPSDEQREQILRMLREKRELASRGIYKPAFLTGDIAIEEPKVMAPDAAFLGQRMENRHEVAIALGIPPSMFDVVASYSIGSASDWFRLLHSACIPLANGKIADGIEAVSQRFLVGRKAPLFASFNFDEHPTMQAVRRERLASMDQLWTKGMPMQAINDYLQLGLPKFEGWDVGYLPFSVAPAGEMASGDLDPEKSEEFSEGEDKEMIEESGEELAKACGSIVRMLEGRTPLALMENALQIGARTPGEPQDKARDPKRLAQWRELMAKRRETEKSFQSKISAELMKARSEVLAKLEAAQERGLDNVEVKAAAADFTFDLAKFTRNLVGAMRKQAATALQVAGEQLFAEIGKDDPFAMPSPQAMAFLRIRENRIKDASEEMFERIKSELEDGISAGESIEDLADRVRAEFNTLNKTQARTIAQTETQTAFGVGRQRAMETAGVTHKQWLTSGNDNVRSAHLAADGQIVPTDEPFDVGGEQLMNPGDPTGSAENVINCRCVAIAVAAPEET